MLKRKLYILFLDPYVVKLIAFRLDDNTSLFGLGCPPPCNFTIFGYNEISFCVQLDHLNTRLHAKFHLIISHARLVPFECFMAVICSCRSNMKI